ncbi:MAG: hypothetical protein ACRC11_10970 [Xenococcaceae cyanobacterium]
MFIADNPNTALSYSTERVLSYKEVDDSIYIYDGNGGYWIFDSYFDTNLTGGYQTKLNSKPAINDVYCIQTYLSGLTKKQKQSIYLYSENNCHF